MGALFKNLHGNYVGELIYVPHFPTSVLFHDPWQGKGNNCRLNTMQITKIGLEMKQKKFLNFPGGNVD